MTISYPDNTNNRAAISASGLTDSTSSFDIVVGGSERKLTLAELKKTGVQVVNVRQYGAVGDGVTDDTVAFSDAADAAMASGYPLYIPPGNYNLSAWSAKTLTADLVIVGAGQELVTISGKDTTTDMFSMPPGFSFILSGVAINTCRYVIFVESNPSSDHKMLVVDKCKFASLYMPVGDAGNSLVNAMDGFRFTSCVVSGCSDGVRIRANQLKYCDISQNDINTISNASGCSGITVSGNADNGSEFVSITRNKIRDITSSGSSVETHGIIAYGRAVIIKGNRIENVGNANGTSDEGLYTKSQNCVVSNNVLINAGFGEGCVNIKGNNKGDVSGSAPLGYASSITGNTIVEESSSDVILLQVHRDDCVVSGNVLQGGFRGIVITGSNVLASSNAITDATSTTSGGAAIRIQDASRVHLIGNAIKNWNHYGVHIRTTTGTPTDFFVASNKIDDINNTGYGVYVEASVATTNLIARDNHLRDTAVAGFAFSSAGANISVSQVVNNTFTSCGVPIGNHSSGSLIKRGNIVDGLSVSTVSGASFARPATDVAKTNNGSTTTLSAISGGVAGDSLTVLIGDSNTTIDFTGTTLKGNNGVDWTPASGDHMVCTFDGTNWYCIVSEN